MPPDILDRQRCKIFCRTVYSGGARADPREARLLLFAFPIRQPVIGDSGAAKQLPQEVDHARAQSLPPNGESVKCPRARLRPKCIPFAGARVRHEHAVLVRRAGRFRAAAREHLRLPTLTRASEHRGEHLGRAVPQLFGRDLHLVQRGRPTALFDRCFMHLLARSYTRFLPRTRILPEDFEIFFCS